METSFYIGKIETMRKELLTGNTVHILRSIGYTLFKWLSLYGRSTVLPLFVWTPVFIIIFTILRNIYGVCPTIDHPCNIGTKFIDSIAAYIAVSKV